MNVISLEEKVLLDKKEFLINEIIRDILIGLDLVVGNNDVFIIS